jgi:hypothetical protein
MDEASERMCEENYLLGEGQKTAAASAANNLLEADFVSFVGLCWRKRLENWRKMGEAAISPSKL